MNEIGQMWLKTYLINRKTLEFLISRFEVYNAAHTIYKHELDMPERNINRWEKVIECARQGLCGAESVCQVVIPHDHVSCFEAGVTAAWHCCVSIHENLKSIVADFRR